MHKFYSVLFEYEILKQPKHCMVSFFTLLQNYYSIKVCRILSNTVQVLPPVLETEVCGVHVVYLPGNHGNGTYCTHVLVVFGCAFCLVT